ncbi:unnamed protein product [Urochloa humidicola]
MQTKMENTEASAASAASVSAVLGDDDLLREILLRLAFPTTLVRAALVSKRWLRHASDPAFLRRFRHLHPPELLGFYIRELGTPGPRFVPVSEAPELATAIRLAGAAEGRFFVTDCRNGRLLVTDFDSTTCRHAVLSPLHPARGKVVLPRAPKQSLIWFLLGDVSGRSIAAVRWTTQTPDSEVSKSTWSLVLVPMYDNIHVREASNRSEDVLVMAADNNLEFVFLWLRSSAVLMHMHLKDTNEKVYDELNMRDGRFLDINPFMMVWPPVFPASREEGDLDG